MLAFSVLQEAWSMGGLKSPVSRFQKTSYSKPVALRCLGTSICHPCHYQRSLILLLRITPSSQPGKWKFICQICYCGLFEMPPPVCLFSIYLVQPAHLNKLNNYTNFVTCQISASLIRRLCCYATPQSCYCLRNCRY